MGIGDDALKLGVMVLVSLVAVTLLFSIISLVQDYSALKELLLSTSRLEDNVRILTVRIGSTEAAIASLRNLIEEPHRSLASRDFNTFGISFEEVRVQSRFTLKEYREGDSVFLILTDDSGGVTKVELAREHGTLVTEIGLSPWKIYNGQILVRNNGIETVSERFLIPPEYYRMQDFLVSGNIWQQNQDSEWYTFRILSTIFIQSEKFRLVNASIRIMLDGELIETLEFFESNMDFASTNYVGETGKPYEFFLDATYGFGGTLSRKIEVK